MRSAVRSARAEPSIRATVRGASVTLVAVGDEHLHLGARIEPQHHLVRDREAADDPRLAHDHVGDRRAARGGHGGIGRRVAAAGVLGQGAVDHTVE